MKYLSQLLGCSCAVLLAIALTSPSAHAQDATPDPAIQAAGLKLFKALEGSDFATLKTMTVQRYARKINQASIRPPATGPKVVASYDGQVSVLRWSKKDAIISASFFSPQSADLPKEQVTKLSIYLINVKGQWLIDAPDAKQAKSDATLSGGYFHDGAFAFCPNKGILYLGGHFGVTDKCTTMAACR